MREHPLTLLAIVAHPDDESFGIGGTLARYAAEGVDVHVCVATDGSAGSADEAHIVGYGSLAERRAEELRAATQVLGATLHTLPYRDSGMAGSPDNEHPESLVQRPLEEVACRVLRLIRSVRPHVVITHDPQGGYFHPDHIKVHRAVSAAWELLDDSSLLADEGLAPWHPQRLYWSALPRTWIRWMVRLLRLRGQNPTRFGRNGDIDLTRLGTPDGEIHARIDIRPYLGRKEQASREHASQFQGSTLDRVLPGFVRRALFGRESFTQAWPPDPHPTDDLFEGLR